jgi:HK97 gp10 family phage protein
MLTSRFPQIILYSASRVTMAIRKAEAAIERRAKARSRVDTGNMRGGWQTMEIGPFDGMVINLAHYTIYNEFGTVAMSAQPMLRPAVEQTRPEFESDVKAAWL